MKGTGICECGCGQQTKPVKYRHRARGVVPGDYPRFITGHHNPRGERHHRWNAGLMLDVNGYALTRAPGHHRAKLGYVLDHILVAERALGKPLIAKHPVHHADQNKLNNAPTNLVICEDNSYHKLIHRRLDAWKATGNPNARKCKFCHEYSDKSEMTSTTRGRHGGTVFYHARCMTEHGATRIRKPKSKHGIASLFRFEPSEVTP